MSTTLTVAAVDQTAKIAWGSMACKLNTLDFTLVDPATMPVIGNAVVLTNPTWSGNVVSIETSDPVDRAGHVMVRVAATNQGTLANVALLPAIMFVAYLALILYFRSKGGYRQVEVHAPTHPVTP